MLKFAIIATLEFSKITWAENFVASADGEVLECLNASMPSRCVMVIADGILRALVFARYVVFRTEIFARKNSERAGLGFISFSLAIKFEWPKIFGINRWTVNSF
jgi:hypothetical protein